MELLQPEFLERRIHHLRLRPMAIANQPFHLLPFSLFEIFAFYRLRMEIHIIWLIRNSAVLNYKCTISPFETVYFETNRNGNMFDCNFFFPVKGKFP